MAGWNEDNFIEKIIPLLPERRFDAAPCPEAAALLAASDCDTGGILKKAMAEHASGCPQCRDLQQRMERFDAPMPVGPDAEWNQTEKRLDNWLESFLASEAAVRQAGDRIRASRPRLGWRRLAKPIAVRRLRWVLVPAATLALVICSFLAGRVSVRRLPQVTAEVASLKKPAANSAPAQTVMEQRAAVAPSAPVRLEPPATSAAAPQERVRAAGATTPTPPPASNSEEAPISPSEQGERAVETAETSGTAPSVGLAGPGAQSSTRATPPGMRSVVASRRVAPAPEATVEHSPAIPAPPVIRLDAGTRVWIALKSVRPRADGVSDFRGLVLLPVTQSGAVLLGRNTEVSGTMSVRNGKKSVQILEFLSSGAHYSLRSAGGEANLRLLGAGAAVEFAAGSVVETWIASLSMYEKLPGESSRPEK
jgi:hypothetical protein